MNTIKRFALLFIFIFIFSHAAVAEEITLTADGSAEDIISLTSFYDSEEIPNPSQAENFVALGLMYHSTGNKFLPDEGLSNALALRLVFRTIGKEAEANALAHNQAERNLAGLKDYDDLSWADGYYLYALKEGLINQAEFTDAYTNPDSPLARDENVSAQNLIRWLTLAHKVFIVNTGLPTNTYIDPVYAPYYASLYKYGFFTASDVEYYASYRQISRDDICLLLEKFETYILYKLNMRSASGKITGINVKFSGDNYTRTITCYASGQTFSIESSGKNIASPFADISGETVVFGKGQPDISGVLRNGDRVKIYYKDDKVMFIRVMEYEEKEEYKPSPKNFSGNLWLYDDTSAKLTVDMEGSGLKTFYTTKDMRAYIHTSEIDRSELGVDKGCIIYADAPIRGGLYRIYSVITN
ncbi:MAG: hypothetical protein IKT39_05495 [Clostridia bacterium]|nr:hypothetical protein [Clostridia bacterium]